MKALHLIWHTTKENLLVVFGFILFGSLFLLPHVPLPDPIHYDDAVFFGSATLQGNTTWYDIAQDMIGFRALIERTDPYPILGPEFLKLGIVRNNPYASTHPPTAYLLTAPLAYLPWKISSTIWAYLMLAGIFTSLRLNSFSERQSLGFTLFSLFWPPTIFSLEQMSVVWLLGISMAYRFRYRPFWSGALIGFAALTKMFPAILLIYFILRRQWGAVLGFALVTLLSVGIVLAINPISFTRYEEVNRINNLLQILRMDNGSFYMVLYQNLNYIGLALAFLFLFLIVFVGRKEIFADNYSDSSWMLLNYFSIALLPISWVYSLVPLLPTVIWLLRRQQPFLIALCVCFFIFSSLFPLGSEISARLDCVSVLILGIGLFLYYLFPKYSSRSL